MKVGLVASLALFPVQKLNAPEKPLTEDVFESSKAKEASKVSFTGNLTASSKRIYSTFVGSLGDFGNKFYEGIESIISFGNRMKEGIISGWKKLHEIGNTEISLEQFEDNIKDVGVSIINQSYNLAPADIPLAEYVKEMN